jgi:pimeloyl-ACP methyl ester carboxylesterase
MIEHVVNTPDGRTLTVDENGDPGGVPILFHNGTPGSRLVFPPNAALAERNGIRLISYDRPGDGGSTASSGRSVADCAGDVRAIAQALGIERLGVWGISGGGPHALACAALLGDLVPAVASLASVAPYGGEGLDYFAGMGEANVEDVKLALDDPKAARAKAESERAETLTADPQELAALWQTLLGPADARAWTGELGAWILESTRSGLEPGIEGWWDDLEAFIGDWGFELSAITTPVLLLHGSDDLFVPLGHGQWLAGQIPGVEARLSGDGHLTLLTDRVGEVYEWLLARLR